MQDLKPKSRRPKRFNVFRLRLACSAIVVAVAMVGVAQEGSQTTAPGETSVAQITDANAQQGKGEKKQKAVTGDSERKKLIADESAQLLDMALALKAEVDKTTKDTLSINVIRKADQIEKLAKSVKDKMKQGSGS